MRANPISATKTELDALLTLATRALDHYLRSRGRFFVREKSYGINGTYTPTDQSAASNFLNKQHPDYLSTHYYSPVAFDPKSGNYQLSLDKWLLADHAKKAIKQLINNRELQSPDQVIPALNKILDSLYRNAKTLDETHYQSDSHHRSYQEGLTLFGGSTVKAFFGQTLRQSGLIKAIEQCQLAITVFAKYHSAADEQPVLGYAVVNK